MTIPFNFKSYYNDYMGNNIVAVVISLYFVLVQYCIHYMCKIEFAKYADHVDGEIITKRTKKIETSYSRKLI